MLAGQDVVAPRPAGNILRLDRERIQRKRRLSRRAALQEQHSHLERTREHTADHRIHESLNHNLLGSISFMLQFMNGL